MGTPALTAGGEPVRVLAIGLAALGGFVNAMGYLSLGRLDVSFMSGNSSVAGMGMVTDIQHRVLLAVGLVAAFVAGVVVGTLFGRLLDRQRSAGVLVLVTVLLGGAGWLGQAGWMICCGLSLALAMGVENTAFDRPGHPGNGITYMTGTLVRIGRRMAEAMVGGPWRQVLPDALLWLGLVVGASLGAIMWRAVRLDGLWLAGGAALAMAGVAWLQGRRA